MSVCPGCHETIVIGRACGCGEHKPVRRDYNGHQPDPVGYQLQKRIAAIEARNAELEKQNTALTARCARLAAALAYYADESIYSDMDPATGEWDSGSVDCGDRARAALTADDVKLAEQWRAMEAEHEAAGKVLSSIEQFADQFGTPEGREVLGRHTELYEQWRAAVAAVEASKEG